jgi:hypothetical protein
MSYEPGIKIAINFILAKKKGKICTIPANYRVFIFLAIA